MRSAPKPAETARALPVKGSRHSRYRPYQVARKFKTIKFLLKLAVLFFAGNHSARADAIVFRTGERLRGAIVAEQPGAVIFDSQAMGRIDVPRERILRLERDPAPAPAESTVLLTTTNTVPAADRETNAPATSRDFLRFYTERGVRYEFVHAIPVIDPFQSLTNLSSENIEVRGRIGFRGSVDAAGYHSTRGQQHVDPDAEVRSLRVYTTVSSA